MNLIKSFVLFLCALFICSIHASCSREKDQKSRGLYENVLKEKEIKEKLRRHRGTDVVYSEEQMAISDACNEQFNSCTEKCQNKQCENVCLNNLSTCEKDLPVGLRTLK